MSTALRQTRVDAGDVIGAILNKAQRTISFTKNGLDLGVAFSNVSEEVLYPIVGMRTPNEQVSLGIQLLSVCSDRIGLPLTVPASIEQDRSKVLRIGHTWPLSCNAHTWYTAA